MTKHLYILLAIAGLLAHLNPVVGQQDRTLHMPLEKKMGSGPFGFASKILSPSTDSTTEFLHIPADIDTSLIWELHIQSNQRLFERYKKGEIDKEYAERMLGKEIDEKDYSAIPLNSIIYIFSGWKAGKKYVIVDANNNKDFGDDEIFVFDSLLARKERDAFFRTDIPWLRAYRDSLPHIDIEYEYFFDGKIRNGEQQVTLIPFNSGINYNHPTQEYLEVGLESFDYRLGEFALPNGKKIKIALSKGPPDALFGQFTSSVNLCEAENEFTVDLRKEIRNGKEGLIDSFRVRVDEISPMGDYLRLSILSDRERVEGAIQVGLPAPEIRENDLGGLAFDLEAQKGKYVLLDFWGTWCKPCIASIPKLEKFYAEHTDADWTMVGIAVDRDVELVRSFVNSRGLGWRQLFIDMNSGGDAKLLAAYSIEIYPTYLLIDRAGQILAMGGSEELEHILALLDKRLKGE